MKKLFCTFLMLFLAFALGAQGVMTLSVSTVKSTCKHPNGSANVTVTGGTKPFTYSWTNGSATNLADSLKAGVYQVTVTDSLGNMQTALALINDVNGPLSSLGTVTNIKCGGTASGSININVSGPASPFTYSWSDGELTQNINSLYAGPYQVSIQDTNACTSVLAAVITENPAITLSISTADATCGNSDGKASAQVSGGVTNYTYSWSNGSAKDTARILAAGTYTFWVTDHAGCIDSAYASISNLTGPSVSIDSATKINCVLGLDGRIITSVTGGSSPYTYSWSNGASTPNLTNLSVAGSYNLSVKDAGGCTTTASVNITDSLPPTQPICIVTVDPTTQRNMVVWDQSPSRKIKSYVIYKESTSAGVYYKIGTVPSKKLSVFVDSVSNPAIRSFRYRLAVADSCGNESTLSTPHKTMHLTVNQGVNNQVNLIWDNYEGLTFSTYYVYRDTSILGSTLLDSIPNNIFTYTDPAPPIGHHLYYQIGVKNPGGCNPGTRASFNYDNSKSNTGNITYTVTGINQGMYNPCCISISPNPGTGIFNLDVGQLRSGERIFFEVYNALGMIVHSGSTSESRNQLDLSNLTKGVYSVRIQGTSGIIVRRIIIQ